MATTDQILRNSAAELSVTFFVNGVATDADGNVTVTVYNPDGTVFDGPVTADDATASDGTYEYDLAPQADLNRFQLDWSGDFGGITQTVTTRAEVVGAFLFTINDARAFQGGKLNDANKYPNADIVDTREEIATLFEEYCKVSFIPRFRREVLSGNGKSVFYLSRGKVQKILSLTEDGTALTENTDFYVDDETGRVERENGVWSTLEPRNVVVEYEHGFDAPPGPIVRAALVLLGSFLVGSDLFDRATAHTDDSGTIRLSTPDSLRDRPTGIPYVDARLNEYTQPWGVA